MSSRKYWYTIKNHLPTILAVKNVGDPIFSHQPTSEKGWEQDINVKIKVLIKFSGVYPINIMNNIHSYIYIHIHIHIWYVWVIIYVYIYIYVSYLVFAGFELYSIPIHIPYIDLFGGSPCVYISVFNGEKLRFHSSKTNHEPLWWPKDCDLRGCVAAHEGLGPAWSCWDLTVKNAWEMVKWLGNGWI